MLSQIVLRGLGVIDEATLELGPGLNVLTGETGAGKTMVVSGLGLLLGDRADSALVRTGEQAAVVEGVVQLSDGHAALERVHEAGGEHDDGEVVLVRTVSAAGRSRAHVGGRSAPVAVLADLREHLVAVHGQSDQWRLRSPEAHREVLDDVAGEALRGLRTQVAEAHGRWRALAAEHEELTTQARDRLRRIDELTASLEHIERLDPQPGEDVALRAEDDRLSNIDVLRQAVTSAAGMLTGDEDLGTDEPSARDLLGRAASAIRDVPAGVPELDALSARADELVTLATELAADLRATLADIEGEPGRLEAVQARRAELGGLTRRYGDTVDEVLEWSRGAAAELDRLVSADERVATIEADLDAAERELAAAAATLHTARVEAARDFGERVTSELRHLAMGSALVEVSVRPRTLAPGEPGGIEMPDGTRQRVSAHGSDDVEILLAANPGAPPRTVARAASGGELSRVMLAIEVVGATGAGNSAPPTFVFDEVDAGVGGKAGVDVGARLRRLAEHAQVVVVTHLAQVAAFADTHLVVHKSSDGSITSSSVRQVRDEERLRELSRMMGGDPDSKAGLAHARTLVEQAGAAWHD